MPQILILLAYARVQECLHVRAQECLHARVQECLHVRVQECLHGCIQEVSTEASKNVSTEYTYEDGDTKATGSVNKYTCFAANKPSHCLICSKYLLSAVLLKSIFNNKAKIHLSSLGDDEWTQGMGRTVGEQWYSRTEESP